MNSCVHDEDFATNIAVLQSARLYTGLLMERTDHSLMKYIDEEMGNNDKSGKVKIWTGI